MQPPGPVTLPPACQSGQRPSPIRPHDVVAQGAESGWHLSSPCRQDATLGFSPVLAVILPWDLVGLKSVCPFFVETVRTRLLLNSGQEPHVSDEVFFFKL